MATRPSRANKTLDSLPRLVTLSFPRFSSHPFALLSFGYPADAVPLIVLSFSSRTVVARVCRSRCYTRAGAERQSRTYTGDVKAGTIGSVQIASDVLLVGLLRFWGVPDRRMRAAPGNPWRSKPFSFKFGWHGHR